MGNVKDITKTTNANLSIVYIGIVSANSNTGCGRNTPLALAVTLVVAFFSLISAKNGNVIDWLYYIYKVRSNVTLLVQCLSVSSSWPKSHYPIPPSHMGLRDRSRIIQDVILTSQTTPTHLFTHFPTILNIGYPFHSLHHSLFKNCTSLLLFYATVAFTYISMDNFT